MTVLSVTMEASCFRSADADAWLVIEAARERTMAADNILETKFFFIKSISFQKYMLFLLFSKIGYGREKGKPGLEKKFENFFTVHGLRQMIKYDILNSSSEESL